MSSTDLTPRETPAKKKRKVGPLLLIVVVVVAIGALLFKTLGDASLFFNVTKNIKIGVQGVNLLDEVTKTLQAYTGDPKLLAPRSYFMNDRRYSFIIRGSF